MSRTWIPVSAVQARMHPLYGRGGWLILFITSVMIVLLLSGGFWAIVLSARTAADSLIRFLGVYTAVSAFAGLVMLALFIVKSPNFRVATVSLLLVPWPVLVAIYFRSLPENVVFGGSAAWLVSVLIWATYLQRSRRVRVTFEHCVLGEPTNGRTEPVYTAQHFHGNDMTGARGGAGMMAQKFDVLNSGPEDNTGFAADPRENCWAKALAEYESNRKKPGIWARAYAEGQGDEAAAKAHYLKLRADQLYEEYQEQTRELSERQRAEQDATALNERYENALTNHQRKIKRAMEQVQYGGEGAFPAAIELIRLLGGTVERKPSVIFSSSGWRAEIAGYQDKFADEGELVRWVINVIIPRARMVLPPVQRL